MRPIIDIAGALLSNLARGFGLVGITTVAIKSVNMAAFFMMAIYLSPHDFGALAVCWIVVSVGEAFLDLGFREVYLRESKPSLTIRQTCYWIFLFLGGFWFCVTYISAYFVADAFNESNALGYLKALSVIFLLRGMSVLRTCIQIENKQYSDVCQRELIAAVSGIAVGLTFAYLNFGGWALVARYISEAAVNYTLLYLKVPFPPQLTFDRKWAKNAVTPALQLNISRNIGWLIISQAERIFIGSISLATLGIWGFAKKPLEVSGQISTALIQQVYFRHFIDFRDSASLKDTLRKSVGVFLVIGGIGSILLLVFAQYVIDLIWSEKWSAAKPVLAVLAASLPLTMMASVLTGFLSAVGCAQTLLKVSVITALISVLFVAIGTTFGIVGVAWAVVVTAIIRLIAVSTVSYQTLKEQWVVAT